MVSNTSRSKKSILIVDDNRYVLRILTKILQKAEFSVTSVETWREALKKLEAQTYDTAIIDVRLQDMNGLNLLHKIQKIAPNMRKIILTGYPSEEDRIKALGEGADYYLAKPIKSDKLIEIIKTD